MKVGSNTRMKRYHSRTGHLVQKSKGSMTPMRRLPVQCWHAGTVTRALGRTLRSACGDRCCDHIAKSYESKSARVYMYLCIVHRVDPTWLRIPQLEGTNHHKRIGRLLRLHIIDTSKEASRAVSRKIRIPTLREGDASLLLCRASWYCTIHTYMYCTWNIQ